MLEVLHVIKNRIDAVGELAGMFWKQWTNGKPRRP